MKSTTTTTKNSPTTAAAVASDHGTTTTTSSLDELKTNLPSEQDRKATLGCLAAVLNRMFRHQFDDSQMQHSAALPTRSKKGVPLKTTSLASSNKSSNSNNGSNTYSSGVSKQRTREFQNELLVTACELLYLDPDVYAVEFLPILDNHNDNCNGNNINESISSHNKKNNDKSNENKEDDTDDSGLSTNEDFLLDPFLSSFSNAKAGFDCISLLLFRYLLLSSNNSNDDDDEDSKETSQKNQSNTNNSKTILGYDARVRYALKYASVSILNYWDPVYGRSTSGLYTSQIAGRKYATQKYEALEDAIAQRISTVSKQIILEGNKISNSKKTNHPEKDQTNHNSEAVKTKAIKKKNKIIRGLKIGSAAIGAGALMALSGGIAVPAIIGGIAAAAGITAVGFGTLTAISLLVLPAAVTIFGVGSGVLVAGKMSNRTKGLTDFEIKLAVDASAVATNDGNDDNDDTSDENPPQKLDRGELLNEPKQQQQQQRLKLARTICINGWIADEHDFERPFGTQLQSLADKSELLKRFCSVYAPKVLPHCDELLEEWKTKEDELWNILKDAYGKDPNHLYPIDNNQDENNLLTKDEHKSIDSVMRSVMGIQPDMLQKILGEEMPSNSNKNSPKNSSPPPILLEEVWNTTKKKKKLGSDIRDDDILNDKKYRPYAAWDFQSTYRGMELYTVSWEQDLLLQLRGSAKDLQKDLAMKGAEQVMKKTVLATLMSAVAIPATLLGLTSLIDEKWTMANERADEAGILLAESLLVSTAGHRPIHLIGISFGARMILSCLQELARHQKKWEKEQQRARNSNQKGGGKLGLLKAGDAIRKSITDSVTAKLGGNNSKGSDSNPNIESSTTYLREPASIIENVVLMGCPASVKPSTWKSIRGVVAGPLINCYAPNDLMLSLMYRIKNPTTALLNPPVGITQVKSSGVTNCDVSSLIGSTNHGDYCLAVKDILDLVGFDQPQKG